MKGFKNVDIYVDGKGIINTSLGIDNGKIAFIGDGEIDEVIEVPEGAVVLPGFIDQHIHGSAGSDAMDGTVKDLSIIANSIACEGTTAFLATTMTQSKENISKSMKAVKEYRENKPAEGAEILGIHLEGPYINPSKAGAQPAEYIVEGNIEEFDEYNKLSGNAIRIVTLAPEVGNTDNFIKHLVKNDIRPSIGHTSATYEEAYHAFLQGASQITHTYNAQSPFTHRKVGVVGAALLTDGLACEVICDTIHVCVPALKTLFKNKPHDKVILITDAMRAKNLGDTISELGGQTVYVKNGEARLEDGTLAGSVLKMNVAIKNIVTKCGIRFTDAVDFASKNPAINLGFYNERGSIKEGKNADFAIMNREDFSIVKTIRNGNVIFNA